MEVIAAATAFVLIFIILLAYLDKEFAYWLRSLFRTNLNSTPLYTQNKTLRAQDFVYLLSVSDIWHLRRIASHYTSTKPMHADPETVSLAVTLEGLGTEGQ